MAAPARVPLGGDTVNRKWWIDKNTGASYGSPTWTPINGISDFKFGYTPTYQDDSDFDSGGAKSQAVTAYEWALEFKAQRKVTIADATVYDPGQEAIRLAASKKTGMDNVIDVRWYEMNVDDDGDVIGPTTEAHRGYVTAAWGEDGGAMDALGTVSIVLNGRGTYEDITHPEEAAAVAPTLYSVTPATDVEAGGALVILAGTDFMVAGVDDVEEILFGAVECTVYSTISDNTIAAVVPAGSGIVAVTVENATGVSTDVISFQYT